jgi:Rrf2 family protein
LLDIKQKYVIVVIPSKLVGYMKFSTKTTYGLRSMAVLAKSYPKNISLTKISEQESISVKYLEQIFSKLKKSNLVESEKGMAGGYKLPLSPDKISVYDIVNSLEGNLSPFHCLDNQGKIFCGESCHCTATLVLKKIQDSLCQTLKSMTLKNLV